MIQTRPFEIKDFTGGITDQNIDGEVNQYELADNFYITDQGRLITRDGSIIWGDKPTASGVVRNGLLIPYEEIRLPRYLVQGGHRLHVYTPTQHNAGVHLTGPTGNTLFTSAHTASDLCAYALWKRHAFIVSSDLTTPQKPQKIYRDETDTYQLRTAGLQAHPAFTVQREVGSSIATQRDSFSQRAVITGAGGGIILPLHDSLELNDPVFFSGTGLPTPLATAKRFYIQYIDPDYAVHGQALVRFSLTPGGAEVPITTVGSGTNNKINYLTTNKGSYLYAVHYSYAYSVDSAETLTFRDVGPTTLYKQTKRLGAIERGGNISKAVSSVSTANDTLTVSSSSNIGIVPGQRIRLTTTGTLPAGISTSTDYYVKEVAGSTNAPNVDFDYDSDTITFSIETTPGAGSLNITSAGSGTHTVNFFGLNYNTAITLTPLENTGANTGQNYDEDASTRIKLELYRTTFNGTTFYKVTDMLQPISGTTTYQDNTTDSDLVLNESLYTNGGVLDADPPPACRYIHVVNDIGYYGATKEGSDIYESRVRQSTPGDPDGCPATLYFDFDSPVRGIASFNNRPIVLCLSGIYRLQGVYDALGRGGMDPQKISDVVGCVSHLSAVQTPLGLFFAGKDGFYVTDGFNVTKVSQGFDIRYKTLVADDSIAKKIYGAYDEKNQRLVWAVCDDHNVATNPNLENNAWYVFDLNRVQTGSFTTASGGDDFAPTSTMYYLGDIHRGDRRGYTFKHNIDYVNDSIIVNTALATSAWVHAGTTTLPARAIEYDYTSCALTFGTSFERKWVPRISLIAGSDSNLSLQITSINDDGRNVKDLAPIIVRNFITWGDTESPDAVWGDPSIIWNYQGIIDEWRRFPAGGLRCETKTVQFTNAYVRILWSDLSEPADVSNATKTAILSGGKKWPSDPLDWFIRFETDGYVKEYEITSRTSGTQIVFSDASNSAPNGADIKWEIWGIPKNIRLHLLSYNIHVAPISQTQVAFSPTTAGGNA